MIKSNDSTVRFKYNRESLRVEASTKHPETIAEIDHHLVSEELEDTFNSYTGDLNRATVINARKIDGSGQDLDPVAGRVETRSRGGRRERVTFSSDHFRLTAFEIDSTNGNTFVYNSESPIRYDLKGDGFNYKLMQIDEGDLVYVGSRQNQLVSDPYARPILCDSGEGSVFEVNQDGKLTLPLESPSTIKEAEAFAEARDKTELANRWVGQNQKFIESFKQRDQGSGDLNRSVGIAAFAEKNRGGGTNKTILRYDPTTNDTEYFEHRTTGKNGFNRTFIYDANSEVRYLLHDTQVISSSPENGKECKGSDAVPSPDAPKKLHIDQEAFVETSPGSLRFVRAVNDLEKKLGD